MPKPAEAQQLFLESNYLLYTYKELSERTGLTENQVRRAVQDIRRRAGTNRTKRGTQRKDELLAEKFNREQAEMKAAADAEAARLAGPRPPEPKKAPRPHPTDGKPATFLTEDDAAELNELLEQGHHKAVAPPDGTPGRTKKKRK
jgi:hypothetical protein